MDLIQLFSRNLFPLFFIILLGFVLQKKFRLDIASLNKINIYLFVPAMLLKNLLDYEIDLAELGGAIVLFTTNFILLLGGLYLLTRRLFRDTGYENILPLTGAISNMGNFGIPLMDLCFGGFGVVVQSLLLMCNNVLLFSLGMVVVSPGIGAAKRIRNILKLPILYVFVLGVVLKIAKIDLPSGLMTGIRYLAGGLVPVALFTLGAQLASMKKIEFHAPLVLSLAVKLLGSPLLMMALIAVAENTGILTLSPTLRKILILGSTTPTAVNVVILSTEFKSHPDIAANSIFWGTLLSVFTVFGWMVVLGIR